MGKLYDEINDKLASWIGHQVMYFVGTAPESTHGHVNISPKGVMETFRVLGPRHVAYLDIVGSGAETISHLRDNGRIVIMLCAFQGPPRIVRLHGRGTVVQLGDPHFDDLVGAFDLDAIEAAGLEPSIRSIIEVEVTRVADSCGYAVPLLEYVGERSQMPDYVQKQVAKHGPNTLLEYSRAHNERSIDGLPGIDPELYPDRSAVEA